MVLIANNSGKEARRLADTFPGRIGHIYSPGGQRGPFPEFPYALDNGAFPAWQKNIPFDDDAFRRHLDWAADARHPPLWVAVPDVVGDAERTTESWYHWLPIVQPYGFPLAFVVQDGHTIGDVPSAAQFVFVGGTTEWKRNTAAMWCNAFPQVHIGRVNTEKWLWHYHRLGAVSCDGSGWFRGDRSQLDGLWYYLSDTEGLHDAAHGPMQCRLPFAKTSHG